jgi:O-antigen biosynthesis protein WbqP
MLIIPLIIIFFDGRPIFYKQKRVGKGNKVFQMYKYRTMLNGVGDIPKSSIVNPKSILTLSGRVLRKYSLDELPQLFNVIKGDMNIIGYRPCLPNEKDVIIQRERYSLDKYKPGITGWAQINGRDKISVEDKAILDSYYYKNHSLFLDIKILFKTLYVVVFKKNISH